MEVERVPTLPPPPPLPPPPEPPEDPNRLVEERTDSEPPRLLPPPVLDSEPPPPEVALATVLPELLPDELEDPVNAEELEPEVRRALLGTETVVERAMLDSPAP
jgi:hypothetical protein